jgi:branched-chain amino acid transport system substrate-binding protein
MKRVCLVALIAVGSGLLPAAGQAEDAVKIGVVMPYSGQFADPSAQSENGLKLYLKQHGNKLGGRDVEMIRKDTGGINPPVAKRLAQELVTRDNVDILTAECTGRG